MCLSTQALFLFLSLLPRDRIDISEQTIVIRAEVRPAVWTARGEDWCTRARQLDRAIRLGRGQAV